jgi:rhodanese-related sulfurtransferase
VALQLMRLGIYRVRPLEGGYAGWKQLGYPVVPWEDGKQEPETPLSVPA